MFHWGFSSNVKLAKACLIHRLNGSTLEIMNWTETTALIAMGAPPAAGQEAPPWYMTMFPFVLMLVVFYFILIRPQQKKAKEHQQLLTGLRSGDKVLTSGGVVGVVVGVKEKTVTVRSADTKIEILKSAVAEITERGSEVKEA